MSERSRSVDRAVAVVCVGLVAVAPLVRPAWRRFDTETTVAVADLSSSSRGEVRYRFYEGHVAWLERRLGLTPVRPMYWTDAWGRPLRLAGEDRQYYPQVPYSVGPNGLDERGGGDDVGPPWPGSWRPRLFMISGELAWLTAGLLGLVHGVSRRLRRRQLAAEAGLALALGGLVPLTLASVPWWSPPVLGTSVHPLALLEDAARTSGEVVIRLVSAQTFALLTAWGATVLLTLALRAGQARPTAGDVVEPGNGSSG